MTLAFDANAEHGVALAYELHERAPSYWRERLR